MKNVLITGCSSGFGRLLVRSFLERGWRVIATMRNAEARKSVFGDELQKYGDRLEILNFDVTSESDLKNVAGFISEKLAGQLDCFINNAGFGVYSALEDASRQQIQNQMDINVSGLIYATQAMLPFLRKSKGHLINFSSVLGFSVLPLTSLYCSSKFAVEGFSEALYYELLPHGVRVSIVEPGAFATDFKSNVVLGEKSLHEDSPYFRQSKNYQNMTDKVMKTAGRPEVVVDAVMSAIESKNPPLRILCGKDARFIYLTKSLVPEPIVRLLSRLFFGMTINRI